MGTAARSAGHHQGRLIARPRAPATAAPATAAPATASAAGTGIRAVQEAGEPWALRYDPATPAARPRLVVVLHGAGGSAEQALTLLQPFADEAGLLLLAPQSLAPSWDVISGGFGPDVARLDTALQAVLPGSGVATEDVSIGGFSDGASYALSLGLTNGYLFSAVLAFSPGFLAPGEQVGRPRIFVSHGVHDRVLPIDRCSRRLVPALRSAGYPVTYREFDGPHVVPPQMAQESVAWLTAEQVELPAEAEPRQPGR